MPAAPGSAVPRPGTALIGLDIGGSKTHGIRFVDGVPVAEATAGSANVQNVPTGQAAANLAAIFDSLGGADAAGGPVERVVAGAGGIDTDDDAAALASLITPHVPGARVDVIHDTRLVLAAGETAVGIALIAGTGSVAWGTAPSASGADRQARSGGWGYLLGDEGSGYWLGREAVRHTLRRHDRGQQPDLLSRTLLAACGVSAPEKLIGLFHGDTGRRYWAAKADAVFTAAGQGHRPSLRMIADAARHLSGLAADTAGRLQLQGPVIVGGGLGMNQPLLQERLSAELADAGLTDIRFLTRAPVHGVRYLAYGGTVRG